MAKRTGDEDDRVVHGGELPEDDDEGSNNSLDDVQVDAPPAQPSSSGVSVPGTQNLPYTLRDRVALYFKHAVKKGKTASEIGYTKNLLGSDEREKVVHSLGADFLFLTSLHYDYPIPSPEKCFVYGKVLPIPPDERSFMFPYDIFESAMSALMGEQNFKDLAEFIDLQSQVGKGCNPGYLLLGEKVEKNFPQFEILKGLEDGYFIPRDPYLFLLCARPESRRFLSLCLDDKVADGRIEMVDYSSLQKPMPDHEPFSIKLLNAEISYKPWKEGGIITPQDMIQTAKKHGFKISSIRQYKEDIETIKKEMDRPDRP